MSLLIGRRERNHVLIKSPVVMQRWHFYCRSDKSRKNSQIIIIIERANCLFFKCVNYKFVYCYTPQYSLQIDVIYSMKCYRKEFNDDV